MQLPANDQPLILNGFEVDPRLAALIRRSDWAGKRTSEAWYERFPAHPKSPGGRLPFVELVGLKDLAFANANLRDPNLRILWGVPSSEFIPGDYDPLNGYLIGFTDYVDAAIIVDLRSAPELRIIYECGSPGPHCVHRTAFDSLSEFIDFYLTQHGSG